MSIHPIDVILHKRDGLTLTDAEIRAFIHAIVERTPTRQLVTDAQIAAFLMAVFLRGLDARELATLTEAMRFSGEVAYTEALNTVTIDKHSTGGVGDKTSLLIAPILAAAGILYALRDHTGTVESPFLITASIMSKKLAEGLNALVLDVKVGSGAFMPTYEKSKFLAELMVKTGEASGTRTAALLTTMDEPLGRFSGNWVEVWECVDIMKQHRHSTSADLIELSNVLSGWMLHLAGHAVTPEEGASL